MYAFTISLVWGWWFPGCGAICLRIHSHVSLCIESNDSVRSKVHSEVYKYGVFTHTQPVSTAITLISNLFFVQTLKRIYGFAVRLALLLLDTAAQQNFCSYSQMASECSIGSLFSPCCSPGLSAHSRVISVGTLLPSAKCARRGSKPGVRLSNQICAVPGEYREAERNHKVHYQYIFLIGWSGDVATVWHGERKEVFSPGPLQYGIWDVQ